LNWIICLNYIHCVVFYSLSSSLPYLSDRYVYLIDQRPLDLCRYICGPSFTCYSDYAKHLHTYVPLPGYLRNFVAHRKPCNRLMLMKVIFVVGTKIQFRLNIVKNCDHNFITLTPRQPSNFSQNSLNTTTSLSGKFARHDVFQGNLLDTVFFQTNLLDTKMFFSGKFARHEDGFLSGKFARHDVVFFREICSTQRCFPNEICSTRCFWRHLYSSTPHSSTPHSLTAHSSTLHSSTPHSSTPHSSTN
jgi:hypothetical protein